MSENLTLDLLKILGDRDPIIRGLIERATSPTYDDFLNTLYDDIKNAVHRISKQKHLIVDELEDATTGRIQLFLQGAGYHCDCASSGGNVDIEVLRNGHRWIGEAKRYTSVTAVHEGYKQLSTRYTPGSDPNGVVYGGLLAYLRFPDAAEYTQTWKSTFIADFPKDACKITDCGRFGPLAFNSEHKHKSYGTPFKVWHVCLPLHHEPEDKSGRATRARRAKKLADSDAEAPPRKRKAKP